MSRRWREKSARVCAWKWHRVKVTAHSHKLTLSGEAPQPSYARHGCNGSSIYNALLHSSFHEMQANIISRGRLIMLSSREIVARDPEIHALIQIKHLEKCIGWPKILSYDIWALHACMPSSWYLIEALRHVLAWQQVGGGCCCRALNNVSSARRRKYGMSSSP